MNTITELQAKAQSLRPLTYPYNLPEEKPLLDAVTKSLQRSRIPFALVGDKDAPAVWRSKPKKLE